MSHNSTLPEEAHKVATEVLHDTLVDLVDLALVGKQAHWNVTGPRFRSIHLHLDEVVAAAREQSIPSLNAVPPLAALLMLAWPLSPGRHVFTNSMWGGCQTMRWSRA
jgi:hypothetical protein